MGYIFASWCYRAIFRGISGARLLFCVVIGLVCGGTWRRIIITCVGFLDSVCVDESLLLGVWAFVSICL